MVNNISGAFRGAAGLTNDYFESLVTLSMASYQTRLKQAEQRQDQLEIQVGVYNDLESKLSSLYSAVQKLRNQELDSIYDDKKGTSSNADVVTATATSDAVDGSYDLFVEQLATQFRAYGDQKSADYTVGAGKGGTITFSVAHDANDDGDTGDDGESFTVDVTINDGDSLSDVAKAINEAVADKVDGDDNIGEKSGFTASVVDNRLVIEANTTGTRYQLDVTAGYTTLNDLGLWTTTDAAGTFANTDTALDASFEVNGISVTRRSNTGLDDVIGGVTLNLHDLHKEADNPSDPVTLTIGPATSTIQSAIDSFVQAFNDLNSWLTNKTGVKEKSDGTYSRGALADNFTIKSLRQKLIRDTLAEWDDAPAGAAYARLSEIGLSSSYDGTKISLSLDSSALSEALTEDYDAVVELLDGVMTDLEGLLEPYVGGSDNIVNDMQAATDRALDTQNDRVDRIQESIERREAVVRDQIARQFAAISSYNDRGRFLMSTLYGGFNALG